MGRWKAVTTAFAGWSDETTPTVVNG